MYGRRFSHLDRQLISAQCILAEIALQLFDKLIVELNDRYIDGNIDPCTTIRSPRLQLSAGRVQNPVTEFLNKVEFFQFLRN